MIGKRFGKLVVVERAGTHITPSGQRKVIWLCKCDCGNETVVQAQDLTAGHTKSCGCLPTKSRGSGLHNLIGQRFGKLVVIQRSEEDYKYESKGKITTSPRWICQCDCGNIITAQGGNLRSGATTNCGCDRAKSKNEIIISNFLTEHNIKYLSEYSFDDLRNQKGNLLRFDFAILDNDNNVKILVEFQGMQHYIDCGWFGLYQRKYSDEMKRNYCVSHNIPLYEIKYDDNLEESLERLLNKIQA